MAIQADQVYKDRDTIITEMASALQASIPDIDLGADSVARAAIETWATPIEGLFLMAQLLHDDMFPQTASALALIRMGEFWGRPIKNGAISSGTLRFTGVGGTPIPSGTRATAPGTADEALGFVTTALATIPNPGTPTAPTLADGGAGTMPVGTFEYVVTFTTAAGETLPGTISSTIVQAASHSVNLSAIPLGGAGTTGRKLYRRKNGGLFALVTTLADNTTTTYSDTLADASLGGLPPTASTAEAIDVAAQSEDSGSEFNVGIGAISTVADAITGITSVTNLAAFTGASDQEDIEVFRENLIEYIRAPKSGSGPDLEVWAEAISGVESATAFPNDNLGTATNGHVTIRISGPGGVVPSGAVQAAVLADLQARDAVNATIHVGTFTPVNIAVTVTITLVPGYLLADITESIIAAIKTYVTSVPVGGTVRRAGIIAAIFGLPGVATVDVVNPATDVTVASSEKPAIIGTPTVQ